MGQRKSMARLYEDLIRDYDIYCAEVAQESAGAPEHIEPLWYCEWLREQGHFVSWITPRIVNDAGDDLPHRRLQIFDDGSIRYVDHRLHRVDTVIGEPPMLHTEESDQAELEQIYDM